MNTSMPNKLMKALYVIFLLMCSNIIFAGDYTQLTLVANQDVTASVSACAGTPVRDMEQVNWSCGKDVSSISSPDNISYSPQVYGFSYFYVGIHAKRSDMNSFFGNFTTDPSCSKYQWQGHGGRFSADYMTSTSAATQAKSVFSANVAITLSMENGFLVDVIKVSNCTTTIQPYSTLPNVDEAHS